MIDVSGVGRRVIAAARQPANVQASAGWEGPGPGVARLRPGAAASVRTAQYWWTVAFIAAAYFVAALVGNALKFTGNVDALWPPVGVGIALLLWFGIELWPGILVGDILADITPHPLPVFVSAGQTLGNVLEVTLAALLVRRLIQRDAPLGRLGALGRFSIILLGATALSATIGTFSLVLGRVIQESQIRVVWRTWWMGDSCGAFVVVPLALAWFDVRWTRWNMRRVVECVLLVAVLIAVNIAATLVDTPLSYLVFPVFVWAALRFGARGGTFTIAVTAIVAIWTTAHSLGPFAVHSITSETLRLQLFLAAAIATTLFASVLAAERRSLSLALASSRARLIQAGDNARRRLERDLHDGAQQRLIALAMKLRAAEEESDLVRTHLLVRESADDLFVAIDELREIAHGIHPSALTEAGLAAAIEDVVRRSSGLFRTDVDVPRGVLDPSTEASAYYVVVEAVTNAQKYAHASRIAIEARITGDVLLVQVLDDGYGGAYERPGSGLEGLRDRVEGMRGTFDVVSPPAGGTTVTARFPIAAAQPSRRV